MAKNIKNWVSSGADLVPILARQNLEDCEQGTGDCVEVWGWGPAWEVEEAAKQLHAQEGEYENEEEKEKEEGEDGRDGVHQGYHKVPQRGPVPENTMLGTRMKRKIGELIWWTYLVTLNTLSSLRALRAERPKDPALSWKFTQNTSNTEPVITTESNLQKLYTKV